MTAAARTRRAVARFLPRMLREQRVFRRFWTAQTISLFGDQITFLALPLTAVLLLHADAAQMGFLTAAGWLPYLLLSFALGAWVDRRGRRRTAMIAADAGRAVLLCTIPVCSALGVLSLAQLYAVTLLVGVLSAVFAVSQRSLFTSIVERRRFVEGSTLLNGSRAFSFVGGPTLAGFLTQLFSAPVAILGDAASYMVSAGLLGSISPEEAPSSRNTPGALTAGARYIRRSPVVRPALACSATVNFINFAFSALFVLYAVRALGISPGALGLVLGVASLGGVAGSVTTGRITRHIGIGPGYALGCLLFTAPLVLVPLAGGTQPLTLLMLFCAEFGSGFGVMLLDISIGAIFAAVIPHDLQSRVSGAYTTVNYGVRPLGAVIGGVLGSTLGLRGALWVATAGATVGFLWATAPGLRRMRELPAEPLHNSGA